MKQDSRYVRWFEEIKIGDIPIVGGKNALLVNPYDIEAVTEAIYQAYNMSIDK